MLAKRTAAFYDREILKYFVGTEAVKNVVIDAETVAEDENKRFVVPAGTVLKTIEESEKVAPATEEDKLEEAKLIVGVLAHTLEFFWGGEALKKSREAEETVAGAYDEPAAAFFWNAIFDTTKLTGYKGKEGKSLEAVKEALSSCRFE